MRRLAAATGRPVTFALNQNNNDPDAWRKLLELSAEAAAHGAPISPQVHGRTVSLLLGLQTFHPFNFCPTWASIGLLPWHEQAGRMRDPDVRAALVAEAATLEGDPIISGFMHPSRIFVLGDPPDYEPPPSRSVTALAAAEGRTPWEALYDLLLVDGGRELLNAPILNYSEGNLDAAREMLMHPTSAFGLGDGGAHAGQTCDASTTTYLLSYWARDRARDRIPLETAVRKITGATAALFGLGDRGLLLPGKKADVNVIDFERLQLRRPESVADLPGGASRLIQRSDGYIATLNSGVVTIDRGEDTGERPGVLLRGAR
jgi:N-acyl-D-aspartate/D-glutamate deacylase